MKRTIAIIAAIAFFSLAASASEYTYKCKQRTDRSPVDPSVGKISVVVSHIKNVGQSTEYRGEYVDSIDKVKVVVSASKNGKTSVLKHVIATAVSEDVMFKIMDNGSLGMSFNLYMDEMEEASIKLKLNGKKVDISLVCE